MQVTTASLGFFGLDCSDKSRVTEAIFSLPSSSSISGCQLTTQPALYFETKALHLVAFQITARSSPGLHEHFT